MNLSHQEERVEENKPTFEAAEFTHSDESSRRSRDELQTSEEQNDRRPPKL